MGINRFKGDRRGERGLGETRLSKEGRKGRKKEEDMGTHPVKPRDALLAPRLHKTVDGPGKAHLGVEHLGLEPDLGEVEGVLENF